ncbi:MAG: sigma-70 family RNA polymerase sigma factor [Planctomycetota bacterium]
MTASTELELLKPLHLTGRRALKVAAQRGLDTQGLSTDDIADAYLDRAGPNPKPPDQARMNDFVCVLLCEFGRSVDEVTRLDNVAQLFDSVRPSALRKAARRGSTDPDLVDDAFTELTLRHWHKNSAIPFRGQCLLAELIAIVASRTSHRQRTLVPLAELPEPASDVDATMGPTLREGLRLAWRRLPARERQVLAIQARGSNGLETASRLGLSPATVSETRQKALAHLRNALSSLGLDPNPVADSQVRVPA